jgi:hypothetical protein
VVNDTHENSETLLALSRRIEELDPDLLVWNGDVCFDFYAGHDPVALFLRPGVDATEPSGGGWASTRSLLYVSGNHDARGEDARLRGSVLAPGPHAKLPYNTAVRLGPMAVIGLDSGEDKPDGHSVFSGTAAFEPYREEQSAWLATELKRPEIAGAPFKVAFSHMQLRGFPEHDDKSLLEGQVRDSGPRGETGSEQGARLWLPRLIEANFHAIVSGHNHEWRWDKPSIELPITQIIGGGPRPKDATVIVIEATTTSLTIRAEGLEGRTLATETWTAKG